MGGITSTINKVKYIGIASLTIAILSVLILNIISSYSSSNTNSNAEPVGDTSTLATPFRYLREVGLPPVDTPSQSVSVVMFRSIEQGSAVKQKRLP